jgi:mono/diheme cytochrome c family protein
MCETFLRAMNKVEKRNRKLPKAMFLLVLAIVAAAIIYSAVNNAPWSWPVPEEAKQLKNPLQPTAPALKSAREVYEDKCAHCHGDTGKGDGRDANRYDPAPTNLTNAKKMNGATDGELFYKISEGKKPMPVFKSKLTEDQRWGLVLLIRSFTQSTTLPPADNTAK